MSHVGSHRLPAVNLDDGPRLPSRSRQFLAIMLKNVLLQIRSSTFCGCRISGFFSILLDILVPVIFLGVMGVSRMIQPIDTPPWLFREIPLRGSAWEYPRLGALQPRWSSCGKPPVPHSEAAAVVNIQHGTAKPGLRSSNCFT